MEIFILIIQVVLGFVFLMAGSMKAFMGEKARGKMPVLQQYPKDFVTFIGAAEVLGAIGLTLPVWLGIFPILTPLAALGLSIIMLGAVYAHLSRREYPQTGMALVFLAGLLYLAWNFLY